MADIHPLKPFIPPSARLLMLGSFPPPRERWSMEFFYPNFNNDMWRIFGEIFKGDRHFFADVENRRFRRDAITALLEEKGIALYDTAAEAVRLKGNASDKFLEIKKPADLPALVRAMPQCRAVAAAGRKAAEEAGRQLGAGVPEAGGCTCFEADGRRLLFFRMPSSSRAYPMPFGEKALLYRGMFARLGMLRQERAPSGPA